MKDHVHVCLLLLLMNILWRTEKEAPLPKIAEKLIYNQNKQFLVLFPTHC